MVDQLTVYVRIYFNMCDEGSFFSPGKLLFLNTSDYPDEYMAANIMSPVLMPNNGSCKVLNIVFMANYYYFYYHIAYILDLDVLCPI